MSKDPAFLFYSSDFLTGVMDMSYEERGKYITLLCYMHQKGRTSIDNISRVVGSFSPHLKSKFRTDENGLWYNERLEEEMIKRNNFVRSRRENGKLGGRKKKQDKGIQEAVEESFSKFWKMYDKPTEKQSCRAKWYNLTESERTLVFEKLPAYVAATPERQFRKNPLTYLNRKIWLDEDLPMPATPKKSAFELLVETGKYA